MKEQGSDTKCSVRILKDDNSEEKERHLRRVYNVLVQGTAYEASHNPGLIGNESENGSGNTVEK